MSEEGQPYTRPRFTASDVGGTSAAFETKNTEETLATMVDDAHVNHVPVMTGGAGREGLREFYSKRFISQMPPDVQNRSRGPSVPTYWWTK